MRQVTSLDEMIDGLDLQDIRYQELSGRRTGQPAPEKPVSIELPMNLQVVWNDDQNSFAVVFKTEIKLPQAEFVIAVSVHFRMGEPSEVDENVMQGFLGETAFNLAYPYIRQAATTLSSQLRVSPVIMLPLMKADVGEKQRVVRPEAEEPEQSE
jgi:hypothetical protein